MANDISDRKTWPAWRFITLVVGLSSSYALYATLLDLPLTTDSTAALIPIQTGFWAAMMSSVLLAMVIWLDQTDEKRVVGILAALPLAPEDGGVDKIARDWLALAAQPRHRRLLRIMFWGGFVSGIAFSVIAIGMTIDVPDRLTRIQFAAWFVVVLPPFFGFASRSVTNNVVANNVMLRLAVSQTRIDILRPEQQVAFTRLALRNGLVWILALTVTLMIMLGDQVSTPGMLPLVLAAIALAVSSFLRPTYVIHKKLVDAKTQELDRLAPLISAAQKAAEGTGSDAALAATRLTGLLSWRQSVAAARAWPTDTGTLLRLFLYLAIPFGGWVASALVESFVDSLL